MKRYVSWISIFLSVIFGASLLSGAGIAFDNWIKFPVSISRPLVIILTLSALVKVALWLVRKVFR